MQDQQPEEPATDNPPAGDEPAPADLGDTGPAEPVAPVPEPDPDSSAIEQLIGADRLHRYFDEALAWLQANMITWNVLLQVGVLMGALVPAIIFGPRLKAVISDQLTKRVPYGILKRLSYGLATIATPLALWLTISVFIFVLDTMGQTNALLEGARSLLSAWIIVRLVTLVIQSPFWSKVAFYTIWPIMVLDAVGVLDNVVAELKAMRVPAMEEMTFFDVVQGVIIFALFFWVANILAGFLTARINQVEELNPSLKALLAKVLNLLLPVVALMLSMAFEGLQLDGWIVAGTILVLAGNVFVLEGKAKTPAAPAPAAVALKGSSLGWQGPWGTTYPANLRLTAGDMTEDEFVEFAGSFEARPPMPWFNVHAMSKAEVRSLYQYIKSLGEPGDPVPEYVPPGQEPKTPYIVIAPPIMPRN